MTMRTGTPDERQSTSIDARVARTEANVEQLSKQMIEFVGEVRQGFTDVRGEIRESRNAQTQMHNENLNRGQAKLGNFGVWVGIGVGLFVTIIGGFASGYIRDLDRVERQQHELLAMAIAGVGNDRDSQITRDRLRTDVDRLTADVASGFRGLDEKLQREMNLMNSATEKMVGQLDERVRTEMNWSKAAINTLDQRGGGSGLLAPRPGSDTNKGWQP